MKKNDYLTSYLLSLGNEVLSFLRSKGASKEDAEDIIQNTYYKIYTLLDSLDEKTLRPWFFRVAFNDFIDLKRKKASTTISLSAELLTSLHAAENDFDRIFNTDEILYLLRNVQTEYREIFFLKYYYDLSYEEIGEMLGMKLPTVKQKLYRARLTIRAQFGGKS
ncbi:MAG: RNA polymerase sigma factor [Solibacillus sp.]